ncbi:MAG: DEAD/DEAH box helicase [Candidatus Rokubacteria bacterium]|nr:DEAD/DEAH box helicase [Candidatus Rokubacteria bacterium]
MSSFDRLHPALQHHIVNSLGWASLRPLQEQTIEPLLAGEHALILAPTAGGKTEAAVLPLLSRMLAEDWRDLSILYVCPIKALLNNLEPRLSHYAALVGRRVELWHGDVGESARRQLRRERPDLLLTTPESLEVMLISRQGSPAKLFGGVRAVVVDELHAFAGDDRGWHLLSVLERVKRLAGRELQRVGLSATIGNPTELLDWLTGACHGQRTVIAPPAEPRVVAEVGLDYVGNLGNAAIVISRLHRGEKRLVFIDSRARVEDLAAGLRGLRVSTFVSHSSLGLDERRRAETAFVEGSDCVIVATSTLELGIDVGDLDRVIQIDAPTTVSAFLQRLGRTGRRPGTQRNCLFLATSEDAFLRAAGLIDLWSQEYVEPVIPPPDPLHILAQQVLALALQEGGIGRTCWPEWIGAMPAFAAMSKADVDAVLTHMVSQGLLFDDNGILSVGPEGERSFGYRHFREIFSVFTSPPLFTVLHGRMEIGQVHEASFQLRLDEQPILLLGGRSWLVTHLDWGHRIAYVEPTELRGRSRWIGSGGVLGFEHCRAIRRVLATGLCPGNLYQRAIEQLAQLAKEFAWVDEQRTAVVRDGSGAVRWWTFAGLRANAVVIEALGPMAEQGGRITNLAVQIRPDVDVDDLHARIRQLRPEDLVDALPVPDDAIDALKFSVCLPRGMAQRTLRRRLADVTGARQVLVEPIRAVTVGG